MTGDSPSKSCALKFSISEFDTSELPASIQAKWGPFTRRELTTKERRAYALKDASHGIYRAIRDGDEV